MPARSSPIKIGDKSYHLRFDRSDIRAIENSLGIGYTHFLRPGIWGSLTSTEAFLWRGLREEDKKGELIHIFDQNDAGKEDAGNFLWERMQNVDMVELNNHVLEGLIACGLFKRKESDEPEAEQKEGDEKNPIDPTGTPSPIK